MSRAIASVETVPLRVALEEAFGYAQAWVDERSALLVRIETADGAVGWGECWGPIAGTRETIEDFLAPEIVGRDPMRVEAIHDDLYDAARAAYQSTVPLPAISGVDIALWDLVGKARGVPIADLLGGRRREAIRAYATGHYFREGRGLEEQYELLAAEATDNATRFGAVKAKTGLELLGYGPAEDVELVGHIREAVGEDTVVMVDANYAYDVGTARRVGRALEDLGVYWFEEPVPPEDLRGYAVLRDALDLLIAGGECHTPFEIRRLLQDGGLDIAQPDLCNVGGFTAGRRVATAARDHNVPVIPHVWGTPIALAASLQFLATLPVETWLEFDTSPNPLREDLGDVPLEPDSSGRISIPTGAGLGIDLEEGALERLRAD